MKLFKILFLLCLSNCNNFDKRSICTDDKWNFQTQSGLYLEDGTINRSDLIEIALFKLAAPLGCSPKLEYSLPSEQYYQNLDSAINSKKNIILQGQCLSSDFCERELKTDNVGIWAYEEGSTRSIFVTEYFDMAKSCGFDLATPKGIGKTNNLFISIMLHELGHSFGLDHNLKPGKIMNPIIGCNTNFTKEQIEDEANDILIVFYYTYKFVLPLTTL